MGKFDQFIDEPTGPAASLGLRFAVEANPDEAAEAVKLARRYRLPVGVVSEFRSDYRQKAQVDDARAVVEQSPKLRGWLAVDPVRASMAHDDTQTLGSIESLMGALGKGLRYAVSAPGTDRGLATDAVSAVRSLAAGAPQFSAGAYGAAAYPFEALGLESAGNFFRQAQRIAQSQSDTVAAVDPNAGLVERGIMSGLRSAGQQLVTLPAGVANGVRVTGQQAMLGLMGLTTFGQSYGKARDQGAGVGPSAFLGLEDATAEIVTEKYLGAAKLLGDAKAGMGAAKLFIRDIAREIPGEMGATIWQNFNEWATLHPEKTVREWLDEQPAQLAETIIATIVGGGAQVGAIRTAQKVMGDGEREQAQAQRAEQSAAAIDQLNKLAAASKLNQRDAVTFKELVAEIADEQGEAPTEFTIDAETLVNTLNQAGVSPEQIAEVAPTVAAQLRNPTGDIRIPVSEFLAAGEQVTAPLVDHLRTSDDAMTRAEAREFMSAQGDQIRQQVEAELQKRDDYDRMQSAIEQVRATFEAELTKAGRFTGNVNKAYADLLANFYGAQAARMGMTPQALLERYGLAVRSDLTEGGRTLDQRPRAEQTADENGMPEIRGEGIELRYSQPTERFEVIPADGHQLYNMAIMSPEGDYLGYVELGYDNGKPTALYDIEVDNSTRTRGIGSKVIESILAANPDARILISNVVPAARGFWEKVGIPQQNVGEGDAYDGTLDWNTYAQSQAGRKSLQARGDARPGGRGDTGTEGGGGSTPGRLLDQDQPGQVGPRAQIALPADLTKSPAVISLLQGADLSSFIHESGHFFLEVQSDLATRIQQQIDAGASVTDGERAIVADMNALLSWFGIKGNENQTPLAEWSAMTLDEKRDAHEKFARGFEAYTMEGKAPSLALQSVFSRFRSWLVQVYKTMRGLNVDLNDDVRAVMDRMLATDYAIEEAQAARNMGPLFTDAKQAGMSLEEFNAYQATAQSATDQAAADLQARSMKDLKWLSRARDKALKARQQEVDELRREIRNEVRSEVMREPVYQAWQFLTGKQDAVTPGTQSAEDVDTALQSGKLRTQVLRDMYGTDETATWRTLSARRMTSDTTGLHPEIAAEMFGYDSADAMVKALADAMPPQEVVDARTDQRMLEMFGDISSPEALQRAADEAVHNEARARFIASEMKALEAANKVRDDTGRTNAKGNRLTTDALAKAAREYATAVISRLKVREIRPSQYAAAEARQAKLAEKAFMAGKTEEAALHKRNQLVNNYATKAAYAAQEEVQSAQKYFRRFDKRSKTIDPGYLDQIDGLLERYDFKPTSLKEIDRRKSFAAWLEEQRAEGIEPNVPPELVEEAGRKSFKDMTLEELRGLRDTIEQLEHLGRLKNRLLLARDERDFNAAAEEMSRSIVENGGKARPVELEGPNPVVDWFAGVAAQHRKLASLFRQMDGNKDHGPMYELIGRAMNERGTMEDVMNEKATMELQKLYAPLLKMKGGITGARSKIFIPEINASLTRGGRLAVALNWGNEANRQRLMDGDKWTEGQVRAILRTLSPAELEFVNKTWEYLDSFWPEIAAKEKRLTGVEPEKVQASPFNVTASDGTEVAMRGGYYPLKYDTERSDKADQQEAAQTAKEMMQGAFTRATTRRGHTKARLENVKRAVRKDLDVITQHVTQVTHDLAWHEWLIDTNKLLGDERVAGAIRDHYGPKVLKTIRDGVLGIATADVAPQTDIDKALLKLRSNVTRATMGASLTTAFLQPFGLTQSMVRIGPKHVLRGIARWGGDAARMENTLSWVHEKSDFMRLRAKTFNKELREIRGSVAGKSKTMRVVDAGLFALMQKMQMVADVPTWVGQYEKSIGEGLDEKAAVAMADRAVLESQGGGQTKDLAEVQRKHPMLTQFYSYFSTTLNLAAESTAKTDFKNPAAVAGWLGDMALLMVIPAIVPSLLMHVFKGGGDDEETLAKKLVEWQLGYLLGSVVGLRELSGAVGGFDYAGPPVGRLIADLGKAGKQLAQGELDEPAVMALVNLMGSAFGIPTVQAVRSYKGWKAWDEGQEGAGPQSVLFGPPPKK